MSVIVVNNEKEVVEKLSSIIESTADSAIKRNNKFKIGLSGGSMLKFLCDALPACKTDWKKWVIFFCDERVVSEDSQDSTFGEYKRALLDKVPLAESQFVPIKQGVTCEEAAVDYRMRLAEHFGSIHSLPRFNLLLLGIGPDGHTCSLFPDHPALTETLETVVAISDSPKPPPERITLTYPVLNNAECCVFALCGSGKADIAKRALQDKEDLPANRVAPTNGNVYWILDKEAAKHVSS